MADLARIGNQTIETESVLQQRVSAVHSAYKSVMREGTHYGVIPGTKKPSLYKPGAEMLCTLFRLVPTYTVDKTGYDGGHREYSVTCTLTKMDTGQVWAQGIGLCSTMESKYRYRWRNRQRVENPDIADTWNTVLKMAKKRALVDATLTATGCSDMFTQDVEDFEKPEKYENAAVRADFAEVEQAPAKERDSRLDGLRGLFKQAQEHGIRVSELMGRIRDSYGCEPDELGADQIESCEKYVRARIAEAEAGEADAVEAEAEEIEF